MSGEERGIWKDSIERCFGSVGHGSVGTASDGSVEGELVSK
jgi:hypothetical protein